MQIKYNGTIFQTKLQTRVSEYKQLILTAGAFIPLGNSINMSLFISHLAQCHWKWTRPLILFLIFIYADHYTYQSHFHKRQDLSYCWSYSMRKAESGGYIIRKTWRQYSLLHKMDPMTSVNLICLCRTPYGTLTHHVN